MFEMIRDFVAEMAAKLSRKKAEEIGPMVDKENLDAFLKEIMNSVDKIFSGQESATLEKMMAHEFENWVKHTINQDQPLDMETLKIGVCLGLRESLRKINEAEEKPKKAGAYIA